LRTAGRDSLRLRAIELIRSPLAKWRRLIPAINSIGNIQGGSGKMPDNYTHRGGFSLLIFPIPWYFLHVD
jgi:hypothetical protein